MRITAALAVVAVAGLIGCGGDQKTPAAAPKAAVEPPKITQLYAPEATIGRGEAGKICFGVEHTKTVRLSPGNQELARRWPDASRSNLRRPRLTLSRPKAPTGSTSVRT